MEGSGYAYCCLVSLRKATKLLSQDSRSNGRDTTPRRPKHKAEMLYRPTLQARRLGTLQLQSGDRSPSPRPRQHTYALYLQFKCTICLRTNFRMSDSSGSLLKIALQGEISRGGHVAAMMDVSDMFIVCLYKFRALDVTNVLLSFGSHFSRQ